MKLFQNRFIFIYIQTNNRPYKKIQDSLQARILWAKNWGIKYESLNQVVLQCLISSTGPIGPLGWANNKLKDLSSQVATARINMYLNNIIFTKITPPYNNMYENHQIDRVNAHNKSDTTNTSLNRSNVSTTHGLQKYLKAAQIKLIALQKFEHTRIMYIT